MSALRDKTNLCCAGCDADLSNLDPIPPPARHFVPCPDRCEAGGIPIDDTGGYEVCNNCEGWGEIVLCSACYRKYLYEE